MILINFITNDVNRLCCQGDWEKSGCWHGQDKSIDITAFYGLQEFSPTTNNQKQKGKQPDQSKGQYDVQTNCGRKSDELGGFIDIY